MMDPLFKKFERQRPKGNEKNKENFNKYEN